MFTSTEQVHTAEGAEGCKGLQKAHPLRALRVNLNTCHRRRQVWASTLPDKVFRGGIGRHATTPYNTVCDVPQRRCISPAFRDAVPGRNVQSRIYGPQDWY